MSSNESNGSQKPAEFKGSEHETFWFIQSLDTAKPIGKLVHHYGQQRWHEGFWCGVLVTTTAAAVVLALALMKQGLSRG